LHMPWIDVDVRVLRRHLLRKAKFWQVTFEHDENGEPDFNVTIADEVFPYEYYVVHPSFARYTKDRGLSFAEKGECLKPRGFDGKPRTVQEYQEETWADHVRNCLEAFKQIKNKELQSLKLLDRLIGNDNLARTEGIVALCIAMHDLGKLNIEWQRNIGVGETKPPLAHTPRHVRVKIPHATVSAYAMYNILNSLVGTSINSLAFELAIGHHHHTRAEQVPQYTLCWQELYRAIIKEINERYCLGVNENVGDKLGKPTRLDASFFDFERKKQYTVYCIVARFIRLSDRASFELNKQNG